MLAAALLASASVGATAQSSHEAPPPASAQLRGLSVAEAEMLIGKLRDLQVRLRAGESLFFDLLAGAPASYDMTEVPPRRAFLELPLEQVFSIERVPTDSSLWRPFKVAILPNGPGRLYWEVEVVLGVYDQVERVTMFYRPPAPF